MAKKMEYDKLILNSCNKAKTTWDIINKESGRNKKRSEIQALKVQDKKITDQQTIAETFNEYFVAIAENISRQKKSELICDVDDNRYSHTHFMNKAYNKPYPRMEYKCTTTKEIEQIIISLKTKNSYGYDEISTKILKISCPFISSPINYICNKMLFWGIFPDRLKYAIIKPIHKSDNTYEIANYRPISLLTSFSKIFEMVMQKRILKHFTKYNILSTEQYGFRVGYRTDNATYKLTTEILNAMNNKQLVGGVFCDLEKAFDCVNHHILLSKLNFCGISDKNFQLYHSYLGNRYCRTAIYNDSENSNKISNWARVTHGVPQGSILGPLLFLVYINDLPKIINKISTPIIFADDTSILFTHSNPIDLNKNINRVFETLNKWLIANELSLNFNKTKFVHFTTKRNMTVNLKIGFNNNLITSSVHTQFLGVTIKNTLSWNNHIDSIVKKLSRACYIIRNAKTCMSVLSLRMIYYAFFHSVMSYGIIFWGNSSHSSTIFKIQKKAIRIMEGYGNRVSCRNLFKKLQILPLASQYILSLLMFVVQNKNFFLTNNENHNLDTRQRNNLYFPQANLTVYQKGTYYSGIKIFNNLPLRIKKVADNQRKFKIALKNFLHTY